MALVFDTDLRDAIANTVETEVGASPLLRIFDADDVMLVEMELPANWLADPSGGDKAIAGTWEGTAVATGDADYFQIVDTGGVTVRITGTVTATGGGGDLTLPTVTIVDTQPVVISSGSLTTANE